MASTRIGGVRATVAALAIAIAAFAFQRTAITPAIPTIEHELGASQAWSAWLLSGYLLASAVFTPVLGKLADRFGKRRLLLGSLVVNWSRRPSTATGSAPARSTPACTCCRPPSARRSPGRCRAASRHDPRWPFAGGMAMATAGAAPGEGAFVLGFAIAAGLALTGTAMALAVRAG